ncbi:Carbonic anhydrase or acetyltransferase, isoleucine patch superfamily [Desulfurobacterium pacificum]|uniref:Carbonic anhydrase or acetyltransferase, isoleucine patch superfamily n=1 Tax=Desulfurobacterium pacificum TaxID=240166 RepID=A0ABY1NIH8_9BACT|nr:gamma carbonic anhydrase family protein [Desulfurobacterium pacificum]SMP08502.1 Carbonic anhydrase or acetyltransferase, isoleucine patch superfamily [Desulfurobacterium pacificum]
MIKEFKEFTPKIGKRVFIAENATVIGNVEIGDDSSIWFGTILRGDVNFIKVGKCTSIQDGSVVHVTNKTHPTVIGNYVTIGHAVKLHGCTIKDNCLIGIGAIILDGAIVNENSIVAAGTLIPPNKEFPPGVLIMGFPGKVVRELTEEEIKSLHEHALRYVKYKDEYLNMGV